MGNNIKQACRLLRLGPTLYCDAWELQREIAAARRRGEGPDTLILLEHEHVYTMGRAGSETNVKVSEQYLSALGIRVIEVDRGGDVTYHGPGQLIGYPILDLREYGRDVHRYCWLLEEVVMKTLAEYGIAGFREDELTGVWTKAGKIASIGIGVRGWISLHGFALNVKPDMRYFDLINPCGITGRAMVSMQDLGVEVSLAEVEGKLSKQFSAVFGVPLAEGQALSPAVAGRIAR
ncbi:MAG: lipoyl(octanoyl) transferase LipB [Negativicutes bacterium]|nr:lipoyl(octanoyl) transferase LipB [Negativicutes bacterium]